MSDITYDDIEGEIRDERQRQDAKWGQQNHDPFKYLAILGEEVGEANKAALESFSFPVEAWDHSALRHYREELVQIAAVTKAMIECLDRDTWHRKAAEASRNRSEGQG